jgi:hypothetical protein
VQPVNDQDDRTRPCVIQPAVKDVVVPLSHRLPLGRRQRLLGFQRIVMMMSAPRPVSTPPTEAASRQPWAVVSNSEAACRCVEEAGGKDLPVPVAGEDAAAVARQFVGEVLSITDAEDLYTGSCPRHHAGNATEARCQPVRTLCAG